MLVPRKRTEPRRKHTWAELTVAFLGVLLGVLLFYVLPRLKRLPLRLMPREMRVRRLLTDLKEKEGWSRSFAIDDLGRIKAPRAIPLLVAALDKDDDHESVINALVMIGRKSVPYLLETAKSSSELGRSSAFKALARLHAELPAALLTEGLFSSDNGIMEASFQLLQQSKSKEVVQAAIERLDNQQYEQRLRAVKVLAAMGSAECTAVLPHLLQDPYPHVRAEVITALEHVKPENLQSTLLAVLRDDDEDESIRTLAAMALGRLKGLPYLTDLGVAEASLAYLVDEASELLQNEARAP